MRLSKAIAEFEGSAQIGHVWQKPELYENLRSGKVSLVYGRKGAGKSTLVEYLHAQHSNTVLIQGRGEEFFDKLHSSIPSKPEDVSDTQTLLRNIELLLELLLWVSIVDAYRAKWIQQDGLLSHFMHSRLSGPNIGRAFVGLVAPLFERLTVRTPDFETELNRLLVVWPFDTFKDAIIRFIQEQDIKGFVCIDDIDDINYAFSFGDRCFIDALLSFLFNTNLLFKKKKLPMMLVMTCPTEIFSHSGLFGGDWVEAQSKCLIWNPESLQQLVNRRIAVEFEGREGKRRPLAALFSTEDELTWNRVFPRVISNSFSHQETTFDYLIRHTLYTPRQILRLSEKTSDRIGELNIPPDTSDLSQQRDLSTAIQGCVSENCVWIMNNLLSVYDKIYDGLIETFEAFRQLPNVWHRTALVRFLESRKLEVTRRDTGIKYSGGSLVGILQNIGVVGIGGFNIVPTTPHGAPGGHYVKLRFAFLENTPPDQRWEVCVFSPVYSNCYGLEIVDQIQIKPHESFFIMMSTLKSLQSYSVPQ